MHKIPKSVYFSTSNWLRNLLSIPCYVKNSKDDDDTSRMYLGSNKFTFKLQETEFSFSSDHFFFQFPFSVETPFK